jgi:carbon-monoxide dehydrogenase small subunit
MSKTGMHLSVNGESHDVLVQPRKLLCDVLREDLHLTGRMSAASKACGACTVLVDGRPMHSCLLFAVQMQGHEIITIEAVAQEGRLSPLQQALHEEHGLQCGFCTAGIVMTFEAWLRDNPAQARRRRDRPSPAICAAAPTTTTSVRAIMKAAAAKSATGRPA